MTSLRFDSDSSSIRINSLNDLAKDHSVSVYLRVHLVSQRAKAALVLYYILSLSEVIRRVVVVHIRKTGEVTRATQFEIDVQPLCCCVDR